MAMCYLRHVKLDQIATVSIIDDKIWAPFHPQIHITSSHFLATRTVIHFVERVHIMKMQQKFSWTISKGAFNSMYWPKAVSLSSITFPHVNGNKWNHLQTSQPNCPGFLFTITTLYLNFFVRKEASIAISADHNFLSIFFSRITFCPSQKYFQVWNTVLTYLSTPLKTQPYLGISSPFHCFSCPLDHKIKKFRISIVWNRLLQYFFSWGFILIVLTNYTHILPQKSQKIHFQPIPCKKTSKFSFVLHQSPPHQRFNSWNSLFLVFFSPISMDFIAEEICGILSLLHKDVLYYAF